MSIISVVLFLIPLFLQHKTADYMVIREKRIMVNGQTSLGGFSCNYTLSDQNDTLFIDDEANNPYCFSIPVEAFSCGNFLLNRDFQFTLKAEEYPEVMVKVLQLEADKTGSLVGSIELSLVGKKKVLKNIDFRQYKADGNRTLAASFVFYASAFQLKPPKRLGGMVKAEDAMEVMVELSLR